MSDTLIFLNMFGPKKSLTLVLLLVFCSNAIELAAFRTARSSVQMGTGKSSCSIHGNRCCCPDMCDAAKPIQSKPSCHSSQRSEATSPRTTNAPCSMKSRCNEKGEPINISSSALKDFLPESNAIDSVIFPISVVTPFLHLSLLNRDLPSPFHPPRFS
jgi:hypothetical protein